MRHRSGSAPVRLVMVFLFLVVLPSLLLAWFAVRAVDAERRARTGRILEDQEQYARIAARAVQHELAELEVAWSDLMPRRAATAAADSSLLADKYVQVGIAFSTAGERRSVVPQRTLRPNPPMPGAAEAAAFAALVARGEAAEFENNDAQAAAVAYEQALNGAANPRLRAMACAELSRAQLAAGDAATALRTARRLLAETPGVFDFDNQPLDLVAQLQEARALQQLGDSGAGRAWLALGDSAAARVGELAASQVEFFRDQADSALAKTASPGLAARRAAWHRPAHTGRRAEFFARKLDRRLLRASTDDQPWSPRVRYLSDVVDGEPYLIAYRFLPDAAEQHIAGIAGLVIDLPRLSAAVLPAFLRDLELSHEARLAIVDEDGHYVIGDAGDAGVKPNAEANLGEPFEFWNVAVRPRVGAAPVAAIDFRTRAYLAAVGVLLLTIGAGAVFVVRAVRRETRLAALKTSFVSNVSHELRTPLASIRMYAEMLDFAAGRIDDGERRRQLQVIRAECGRLERLIDSVLDFASLQRGTRRFQFEYEELGPLVAEVAAGFREQAAAGGFEFRVEVDPDLPEVRADADAIRQVVLNLLSNAVKYSDTERWIAVRVFRRAAQVAIQVEDHGIGIAAGDQRRIFEEFFRVDQRLSTPQQGLGLGLTLVRRIVEAHGGTVQVESSPGAGARFTVWLPTEAPPPGAAPAGLREEATS